MKMNQTEAPLNVLKMKVPHKNQIKMQRNMQWMKEREKLRKTLFSK